jgi:uncharacterized protein with HEPN domain
MRNVLAHEYLGVDITLIWETLTTQLDKLRDALESVEKKMSKTES